MRKILVIILSLLATPAFAQSNGHLQAWQLLANPTASAALATGSTLTSIIDGAFTCSAQGSLLQRGASNWQCLAPGTSGQLLQSGGASANNAWATAGNIISVKKQIFTGSGTYTPSAGMVFAVIECVGSGGGGGGVAGGAATTIDAGGGGGGSYSRLVATAATIGASQTVTIGTAGTAGSAGNNSGGAGGDTSVGTLCVGKGGSGGGGGNSASVGLPGTGGVAGTGDLTVPGSSGGGGALISTSGSLIAAGAGGASGLGFGAGGKATPPGTGASVAGVAGSVYGGGGSGASANATTNVAGGAGALGVVFITEYNTQ